MVNLCLRLWRRTKDRGKGTKQQQDTSANAGVTSEKGNKMAAEIAQAAPATLPEPTSSNGNRNGASDTEITTATPATTLFNGTRANGDVAVDQTDSDEEVDRESLIVRPSNRFSYHLSRIESSIQKKSRGVEPN